MNLAVKKKLFSGKNGPVAQLGERSVRIREVVGSNPFRSTTKERTYIMYVRSFFIVRTTTDCVGGAKKALAMSETKNSFWCRMSFQLPDRKLILHQKENVQNERQ